MVQVCSEDVWRGVVSSPTPKPSEGGNDPPLNVSILASGTTLSVEWTGSNGRSWHQVVCSNGRQTLTTLEEGGFGVSITGAQPNTTYSCCVSCLGNSTRMVYTHHSSGCASETTAPVQVLSPREIGLVAAGGVLLVLTVTLLLVTGTSCCALCRSKHRQGQ